MPFRLEVCGLPIALSATLSVPVRVPVAVGVKVRLMVQLVFAPRLLEQVVDATVKSPVVVIEMPVSETACSLVRVKVFAGLVVPTGSVANVALAGVSFACTPPVPDRATVCGLLGELSVMVKVPVRAPSCVGVKVTLIRQLFPPANVLPQGLVLVA